MVYHNSKRTYSSGLNINKKSLQFYATLGVLGRNLGVLQHSLLQRRTAIADVDLNKTTGFRLDPGTTFPRIPRRRWWNSLPGRISACRGCANVPTPRHRCANVPNSRVLTVSC